MSNSVPAMSAAHAAYLRIADPALGAKPWLIEATTATSFAQLRVRIETMTSLLRDLKIATGDRVVIASTNDGETAQLFVALICNGVTAVNLDPAAGADRARSLIAKADPVLIIADRAVVERWELAGTKYRLIPIGTPPKKSLFGMKRAAASDPEELHMRLQSLPPSTPPAVLDPETLAYVMFTSGTTDAPKGVSISHRALFSHLSTLTRRFGYEPTSRLMNTLMLAHADGMIQGPVMAFYNGIPLHRSIPFEISSLDRMLDAVYRLRITHLVAVPTMLALMLRLGLGQRSAFQGGDFRLLISCGAQLEAALCEQFERSFAVPVVNMYGLTETVAGGVFSGPAGDASHLPGGIGLPEDCELRIVDATGSDAAEGELLMRGSLLMSGYFEAPAATAEVMTQGWLRTGDIARRDSAGRYAIVGRVKNIIIRGGYNVQPEEITEVLQAHPLVREAVTFGVPDAVWGEIVASLVVADRALGDEALAAHCTANLEPRKVPTRIERVDALPRGLSGKVQIERARELWHASTAATATTIAGTGTGSTSAMQRPPSGHALDNAQRVLQLAAKCFKTSPQRLTLASEPHEVPGWDSLAHLEFVVALEQEFAVRLSAGDIMSLDRIDKAVQLVATA